MVEAEEMVAEVAVVATATRIVTTAKRKGMMRRIAGEASQEGTSVVQEWRTDHSAFGRDKSRS